MAAVGTPASISSLLQQLARGTTDAMMWMLVMQMRLVLIASDIYEGLDDGSHGTIMFD